jgi:subtilisin family serine protease
VAAEMVKLPDFQNRTNLSGQGVLIGIIDTGIDSNHAAFQGRIIKMWDQTTKGEGVPEGSYGNELQFSQYTESPDEMGHGTHVAGIASGKDSQYQGVAPNSELIVVKSDLQTTQIADGIRYIFRVASDMQRPAVINLSLGSHFDPHDGTDDLSTLIDSEVGEGRIVCCAAGNEGEDCFHARTTIAAGKSKSLPFTIPAKQLKYLVINAWYNQSAKLEIAIRKPNGDLTPWQPVITRGDPTRTYRLGRTDISIATQTKIPFRGNNDYQILIQIESLSTDWITAGQWSIKLRNVGKKATTIDAWIIDEDMSFSVPFTGKVVANSIKIGSPGASKRSITVGSFTTRAAWLNKDGDHVEIENVIESTVSQFSNPGTLRDNTLKPDLVAPGAYIASALSSSVIVDKKVIPSDGFCMMAGTSMAAPFVAGIVALLLERNRNLTPEEIKALLKKHCAMPQGVSPSAHDPQWGFGLIDLTNLW